MKFNIMSDLHLEFSKGNMGDMPGGDILLLAGDIGLAKNNTTYMPFLEDVTRMYNHVYMIMGNHEHYHGDFGSSFGDILKATSELNNFTLMENNIVHLNDDTILIAATLWSDIHPDYELEIMRSMNDYRIIDNFDTKVAVKTFNMSKKFILDTLKEHRGKTVVVMTHHAPSLQVPKIYRGNSLNSAYGSDLEKEIKKYKPVYWIHGHTHVSRKYTIGDTQIICNPRGYYNYEENPEFDINLEIEI